MILVWPPPPPLFTFHCKSDSSSKRTLQTFDSPPKPRENELPLEGSCRCLKPKHLPAHTILLIQNIIQQCALFRPTGNGYDRPASAKSSVARKLPNWSVRSPASCAQNCTGYVKNFVTLCYFKPFPPPVHRTSSQKSQPPPSCIGVWCHLWMSPFFIFHCICAIRTVSSSWRTWPWWWRYYDWNLVATFTSWWSITSQKVESSATQQWEPLISQ